MCLTFIEYCPVDLFTSYIMYNPPDVRWDVLNDIMSSYYLRIQRILGLNALWQLNGRIKWQCSRSKHQYFVCLIAHSIYQWIVLNLWFGRSRGSSKLWEFFRNFKVDSSLEYSTLGWAHKTGLKSYIKRNSGGHWFPQQPSCLFLLSSSLRSSFISPPNLTHR